MTAKRDTPDEQIEVGPGVYKRYADITPDDFPGWLAVIDEHEALSRRLDTVIERFQRLIETHPGARMTLPTSWAATPIRRDLPTLRRMVADCEAIAAEIEDAG